MRLTSISSTGSFSRSSSRDETSLNRTHSSGNTSFIAARNPPLTGALTIEPDASETIDGQANNAEMDAAYDTITIVCDGTQWLIAAKKIAS